MDWKAYNPCCEESAKNPEAAFCGECRTQLLRCVAYSECGSLVEPLRPCTACLGAELYVDQGAVTTAKVGQQLSLPLILKNSTTASRPIWVRDALVRRDGGEPRSIELPWERLEAGAERTISVSTGALDAGGTGTLEVSFTLGTSYKGNEERYVFGSEIQFSVDEQSSEKVEQHINFAGAQFGTGGLVNIKDVAAGEKSKNSEASNRILLPFDRHERSEVERGTRGYQQSGIRVPRVAPFRFVGFPKGHAPQGTITVGPRNTIAFGRNSRQFDAQENPTPSDVVLSVIDSGSGELDIDGSNSFSRHHFDLVVRNDRLCAHVRGSNGILVNDQHIPTTKLLVLQDGDTLTPVRNRPDHLSMRVQLVAHSDGTLEEVQITRTPDLSDASPASAYLHAKTLMLSRKARASSMLEVGTEFDGRYLIERTIDEGGMGTVYLAKDIGNSDQVALKLIHQSVLVDASAVDQLIAEGNVTRKIKHPNVVAVNRVAKAGEQPYIEMEYLDGKSLRVWISEKVGAGIEIAVETAQGIINALLDGLQAAHAEGVVHRDLKPENVILLGDPTAGDFRLKILDYYFLI